MKKSPRLTIEVDMIFRDPIVLDVCGHRCESCGVPDKATGYWSPSSGRFVAVPRCDRAATVKALREATGYLDLELEFVKLRNVSYGRHSFVLCQVCAASGASVTIRSSR